MLGIGLLGMTAENSASAPPAVVVHIKNGAFVPNDVKITSGQSVQWVNEDDFSHSATADDNSWSSDELTQNQTWTHAFTGAGIYTYHCSDHPFMKAKITVNE